MLITISVIILAAAYVFQHFSYAQLIGIYELGHPDATFIINRVVRMIINDSACILLIYALFGERRYLRVAFVIFCFELFLILPVYLVIKLRLEGPTEISSPLLSQIHRLVVNPMLMIILIFGFYYQRWTKRNA